MLMPSFQPAEKTTVVASRVMFTGGRSDPRLEACATLRTVNYRLNGVNLFASLFSPNP